MKKSIFKIFFASLGVFLAVNIFFLPNFASAHFFETDGGVGGVLHVDPNDAPIAGDNAAIFVAIQDAQKKFSQAGCDCVLSISQNDKEIFSQQVPPSGTTDYIFKGKGVYTIALKGAPKKGYSFQNFSLSFDDFNVTQDDPQALAVEGFGPPVDQSNQLPVGHDHGNLSFFLLGGLAVIYFLYILDRQQENHEKKEKK